MPVWNVTAKVNGVTSTVANAFSYKPFGPRTSMTFGNGLTDSRTFDSRYQLGTWTLGGLLNYTHSHNKDGNLTSRTDNLNAANNRLFTYDGAHRLIQAGGPWGSGTGCSGATTYTYDKNGNRLCKGEAGSATNYTYTGGSNRLAAASGGEPASYSSDSNGNTTGDSTHTYQHDSSDRLASVDMGNTATYTYDGDGRRTIKKVGGVITYFFYDPTGTLLSEVNLGSASGKDYLYLGGTPLARIDWSTEQTLGAVLQVTSSTPNVHLDWSSFPAGGNTYVVRRKLFSNPLEKTFDGNLIIATPQDPTQSYDDPVLSDANLYMYRIFKRALSESLLFYHSDHLNTPIAMTSSGATFVWRAELFPFGGIQSLPVSSSPNNLRLPGQYSDVESGLNDNLFRDYQPKLGRYYEPDPVGLSAETNLWLYAEANPINLMDPSGLAPLSLATIRQKIVANKNCTVVSDELIICMAWKESNFDPGLKNSGSSAAGLLQVTKDAATDAGCQHAQMVDPDKNIACGSKYLCLRIKWAKGNIQKGLEGFGTGPGYATDLLTCETCLKTHPNKCSDQDCLNKIHK